MVRLGRPREPRVAPRGDRRCGWLCSKQAAVYALCFLALSAPLQLTSGLKTLAHSPGRGFQGSRALGGLAACKTLASSRRRAAQHQWPPLRVLHLVLC